MQTFRRLTPAVSAAVLATVTVVVLTGAGVRNLIGAQEPAEPKTPAAKAADSEKAQPKAAPEDPKAAELMQDVFTRLMERASVRARLKETVFLGDRRTTAEGTYLSGTFPLVRVEYRVRVGGTAGVLTEVCDGSVVHTKRELLKASAGETKPAGEAEDDPKKSVVLPPVSASETKFTRCDVQQVAKAIDDKSRPPAEVIAEAGIGGLPATIASLRRCMVFDTVRELQTKAGTFTVVEGRWNPAHLDKLTAAFGPGGASLKQVVPERAAIYLDPTTLFPTRIVYLRRVGEGDKAFRPVLALEFLDVQFDTAVSMDQFTITVPPGVEEKDETAEYIAAIKPQAAPQSAPGQGLPAELFPGKK